MADTLHSLCRELLTALQSWSPHGGGPLEGDKKAVEADLIAKATSLLETCNRRLDKCMSVTNDQLEMLAEIFSETDRADKISLHCDPVTKTVTVRYEDLDDGWFNDLCNIKSSLNS